MGYAALAVLCLAIAGASFLFIAAPQDLVRDRVVEEVTARTGRTLSIEGPVSLSLLSGGATFENVTLSPPKGFAGPPTLTARALGVDISLGALLSRKLQVRRVRLDAPDIALVVDRNGRRSWDFANGSAPGRVRLAQVRGRMTDAAPTGKPAFDAAALLAVLGDALPTEVVVASGRIRYLDERSGETLDVTGIDATAAANDPSSPVVTRGRFTMRGQALDFSARLTSPRSALLEGVVDISLKATGAPFDFAWEGTARLTAGAPAMDGSLVFKSGSVTALGLWLGRPIAAEGLTSLSLSSRTMLENDRLSFSNFVGTLSEKPAQGSLAVDFKPARPRITGQIEVASLDFGALLLRHPDEAQAQPLPQPRDPIGDILRRDDARPPPAKSQVRGYTKRSDGLRDWSDDRLDTRLLTLADADVRISAGEILHQGLKTGPARIALNLSDGLLRVDLESLALYGGRGKGVVEVDAARQPPALSLNLALDAVDALPFLKDASGFDRLEGRVSLAVAIAGQGHSEREVIETLSGTVELKSAGGAIVGISLPKVMRSIETAQIPDLRMQATEKTPFSELGALYVISKGMAQNNDLRLVTQNARLAGSGVLNLPKRQLDYTIKARLMGTGATREEGAVVNFSNIEVPLRVEGPWEKPVISIKGQDQIVEGIKQIGKNLKNPEVQDAIKGLFGGGGENRVKPRDLLDKLLKKE